MVEAMNALTTGASLAKAAEVAGYASQPGFGDAFRGLFGMTPGQVGLSGRVPQPAAAA